MGYRIGSGYRGTSDIITSTANQNILGTLPITDGYYKFSFINTTACHVKINGGNSIFLDAKQGFECTEVDARITEFVIVEAGISYQWIGCY